MREAGASAVTLTNRFLGFVVNIETARPFIYGHAGVGGPWVKPLTLRWISKTYEAMPDLPITGSNGCYDASDMVEFMMSGARIVQMCSAVMLKGYPYLGQVVKDFGAFLDRKGYATSEDIVGLAARAAMPYDQIKALPRRARRDRPGPLRRLRHLRRPLLLQRHQRRGRALRDRRLPRLRYLLVCLPGERPSP